MNRPGFRGGSLGEDKPTLWRWWQKFTSSMVRAWQFDVEGTVGLRVTSLRKIALIKAVLRLSRSVISCVSHLLSQGR
jgi:hypothetical protein